MPSRLDARAVTARLRRVAGLALLLLLAAGVPAALAANVYVTNFNSGTVSQYAVAADGTLTPLAPGSLPTGAGSAGIAVSPDRRSVYVANSAASGTGSNTISQFSVSPDGTLVPKSPASVTATRATGIAMTPDGAHLYATGTGAGNAGIVSQFDVAADGRLTAKTPATVTTGANQAQSIVVNATGTRAYVGHNASGVAQLAIAVDGSLSTLAPTVTTGLAQSQGVALSPNGQSLYVANRGGNTVARIAVAADGTLATSATVVGATGGQPNRVTLSADGTNLYVANQQNSDTGQSISQFTVNSDGSLTPKTPPTVSTLPSTTPRIVVLSSDGQSAYVPTTGTNNVSMFNISAGGVLSLKSTPVVASDTGPTEAAFSDGPPALAAAPAVTTGVASSVTASGAQLAGSVTPNGAEAHYTFEYGPTLSFGSITDVPSAGAGASPVPVSLPVSGLAAGTTYYFRLVATNSVGSTHGAVGSFRTTGGTPAAPVVVTGAASGVANTTADVAGQVNPRGQATVFTVEYGPSLSFGSIGPVVPLDDADAPESVSTSLSGLAPDTTYFFRLVATNATGTTAGAVGSFTTGPGGAPIATTGAASAVTATSATLAGTVDPHGAATAFAFEYGLSNAFGLLSAVDSAGAGSGVQPVSLPLTGLSPGTTYCFRIVATNANGTVTGTVGSFTTPPAA